MYVLIHLLGQKLNMCSHRFIALGRYRTISLPLATTPDGTLLQTLLFYSHAQLLCLCAHRPTGPIHGPLFWF